MKPTLLFAAPLALALTACDPNGSYMSGSGIDPLRPPSSGLQNNESYGIELQPGQFVSAAINNTAFYKNQPKDDQEADKLLTQGTPMKIIALLGSFTKVELDSGEVGFIPTVMISTGDSDLGDLAPVEGAVDIEPPIIPLDGDVPLPVVDPSVVPAVEPTPPTDPVAE
jgi:hypothetical protein